jgi:hypothetical protein
MQKGAHSRELKREIKPISAFLHLTAIEAGFLKTWQKLFLTALMAD